MTNFFKRFAQDESGAVTVDWVVLTAAIVGLGIAISSVIFTNVKEIGNDIDSNLAGVTVDTTMPAGGGEGGEGGGG